MTVVAPAPERLVDLERYPIDALDTSAGHALVERCRAQLLVDGACELPGFLTDDATAFLASEASTLAGQAHPSRVEGTPYLDFPDESLPEGHPRRALGANSLRAVAYDLFPADSGLRAVYEWPVLRAFVAAVLDVAELFPYGDPLGALNLAVMADGDELAWHFDQTDFVVSLALVPAERGGDFEFVPRVRTPDDEHYQEVVALLAYDTKPGTTSSDLLRLVRYGRGR